MNEKIFSSSWSLKFLNLTTEDEFQKIKEQKLRKFNIVVTIISFLISLSDSLYHIIEWNNRIDYDWFPSVYFLSFIIFILYIPILLLLFNSSKTVHRFINYYNYFIITFPFFITRSLIAFVDKANIMIFTILFFFEMSLRITYFIYGVLNHIECFILNLCIIPAIFMYTNFVNSNNNLNQICLSLSIILLILSLISYFYCKENKKSFYYKYTLERLCKWYKNIFDKITTGYIHLKNSKIEYMNNMMIDKIYSCKALNLMNDSILITDNNLFYNSFDNNVSDNIRRNSTKIIEFLLSDIALFNKDIINFDKNQFSNNLKKHYLSNYDNNNFIFIGIRSLIVDNQEIFLEVHYRYYSNSDNKSEDFEFLFNDVTRTKQIEEKNAEIKFKSLFLSKVAHEFKNPLICISELIEQILEKKSELESLPIIKSLSNYLLILIKNLDFFSQKELNNNSIQNEISNTSMEEIICFCNEIALGLLRKMGKSNDIQFFVTKSPNLPNIIQTDEIKLKQILVNLISNSIKFTCMGKIILEIIEIENLIKFCVRDTGSGISDEIKKKLFIPFSKGLTSNSILSAGLGLSIVNELCSLLGSSIEFDSSKGKGTSFWFYLPNNQIIEENPENIYYDNDEINHNREIQQIIASVIPKKRKKNSHKYDPNNEDMKIKSVSSNTLSRDCNIIDMGNEKNEYQVNNIVFNNQIIIQNRSSSKLGSCISINTLNNKPIVTHSKFFKNNDINIIVVDDEPLTRQATIRILNKFNEFNLNIIEADDGLECLYYVYEYVSKNKKIDCIFSDESMNYMNGSQTAELVYKFITNNKNMKIPFFLLTAYSTDNIFYDIKYIDRIITKPIKKDIIEDILNNILRNHG